MGDRNRRSRSWRAAVPLVTLIVGVLLATSAQLSHGTDLRVGRRAELTDLIAAEEHRGEQYQQQVHRVRAQIGAESKREARRDSRIDRARRRAQGYAPGAAFTRVTGTGVRVTLDDATQRGSGSGQGQASNASPNDLVVHQQDVQAVVNALWAGGARGLQIMDQRIIGTDAIRCVGNTLILQGIVYSPPYTITAVGDPQQLRAALREAPQVRIYRQYVEAYGLGYEVEDIDTIALPARADVPDFEHATVPGP